MSIVILLTAEQAAQIPEHLPTPFHFLLGRIERIPYDGTNAKTCGKEWRIVCIVCPDTALEGIRKAIEKASLHTPKKTKRAKRTKGMDSSGTGE